MATEQERQLFALQVLAEVGREAMKLPKLKVTGFMTMVGCLYDHALMVMGRAVNGWTTGILPKHLVSHTATECYSQVVLDSVNGGRPCPMRWVTESWGNSNEEYNPGRSAFWRTIRGVVDRLEIADVEQDSWPSHLVWSNLYKIAPEKGGNPDTALCRIQLAGCIELFKLELMTYIPSRLLLLTGNEWALPFLPDPDDTLMGLAEFRYVERIGILTVAPDKQPIRYVVAAHPQGKPEEQWISEVCCAFGNP